MCSVWITLCMAYQMSDVQDGLDGVELALVRQLRSSVTACFGSASAIVSIKHAYGLDIRVEAVAHN